MAVAVVVVEVEVVTVAVVCVMGSTVLVLCIHTQFKEMVLYQLALNHK